MEIQIKLNIKIDKEEIVVGEETKRDITNLIYLVTDEITNKLLRDNHKVMTTSCAVGYI